MAVLVTCATGCSFERTRLADSAVTQHPTASATLDFWDALATQSITTNDDALHALILFQDGDDGLLATYDERVDRARALGWIPATGTAPPPDESATVGMLATAGCHILKIEGGLSVRLFGLTPRYSLRELVHIGVLPGISEHEALSGAECIAFIESLEQRQLIEAAWRRRLHPDAGAVEPFTGRTPDAARPSPAETDVSPPDGPRDAFEASQKDDQP
jgi:hypothetical protein